MVNLLKFYRRQYIIKNFILRMFNKTWQKESRVLGSFYKCVYNISKGSNRSNNNFSILIFQFLWRYYWNSSFCDSIIINGFSVLNPKGDILNSISMDILMIIHFPIIRSIWTRECEYCAFIILNYMSSHLSLASFKAFVGIVIESESYNIKWWSLHSITNPKMYVIKT